MGEAFSVFSIGKKGQGEWSEIFMTVMLTACAIMVGMRVPDMVSDIATLMTLSSAEKTARDMGGLITISGAATDTMIISYESEDPSIHYDLKIEGRRIIISEISQNGEVLKSEGSPISKGWGKMAVGHIVEEFEDKNVFVIKRTRVTSVEEVVNNYEITAGSR